MGSRTKIPTLLGLGILVIGLVVSILLTTSRQMLLSQAGTSADPKNITVTNIAATSASIYWNTDKEAPGFVQAGRNSSLDLTFKDDRDERLPQNHKLHFVTLTNLIPNTVYNYKVGSGASLYPTEKTLSFMTAPELNINPLTPLIGSILDTTLQPTKEALLILRIDGAASLATVTKVAGNFILPIAELRTQDLTQQVQIPESGISATLEISDFSQSSKVTLKLPLENNVLSPIILGQDLDLTPKPASPSSELVKFDLNDDGVVNSLDTATLLNNFGPLRSLSETSKKPRNEQKSTSYKKLDLNSDGMIDQKDVDLLNKYVLKLNPK